MLQHPQKECYSFHTNRGSPWFLRKPHDCFLNPETEQRRPRRLIWDVLVLLSGGRESQQDAGYPLTRSYPVSMSSFSRPPRKTRKRETGEEKAPLLFSSKEQEVLLHQLVQLGGMHQKHTLRCKQFENWSPIRRRSSLRRNTLSKTQSGAASHSTFRRCFTFHGKKNHLGRDFRGLEKIMTLNLNVIKVRMAGGNGLSWGEEAASTH